MGSEHEQLVHADPWRVGRYQVYNPYIPVFLDQQLPHSFGLSLPVSLSEQVVASPALLTAQRTFGLGHTFFTPTDSSIAPFLTK